MINASKSLVHLASVVAALSLAGCAGANSERVPPSDAAAQHRFLVYFDVAKSDLTPEAQRVIVQAVAEAKRNASARIAVAAPETGSEGHRADTVRAALVAGGVSPDRIEARWIGPQGSPPPGVRDPRDRAVAIGFESDRSGGSETASLFASKQTGN